MRFQGHLLYLLCGVSWLWQATAVPTSQSPFNLKASGNHNVSTELFYELEELARIVDISYCVGTTGIQKPFLCASRCQDFFGFELVSTWNTGPLLSDSCGYLVVSHAPYKPRIIIAFRGTYSIANTVIDLSTIPQDYVPYPTAGDESSSKPSSYPLSDEILKPFFHSKRSIEEENDKCTNCTVHSGFLTSWLHTRPHILPHLERLIADYPTYQLTLVGHSLGGAVAALASLDFQSRGWKPQVTTFGEPRVGNQRLMDFLNRRFKLGEEEGALNSYRRVTHIDDPVPLLPLQEWGYRMHGGEIYISKADLSPSVGDLRHCDGDADPNCIAGAEPADAGVQLDEEGMGPIQDQWWDEDEGVWKIPARYKLWQLFFAHRDYFWRLGLCVPGGDPRDWYRKYPHLEDAELR
ncbi:MAG: hypothetical protein M1827_000814 [Pycnora praestabilis]|nr:MAG: hypothetical protein M1827_000814 [Pycnora praestabilis]